MEINRLRKCTHWLQRFGRSLLSCVSAGQGASIEFWPPGIVGPCQLAYLAQRSYYLGQQSHLPGLRAQAVRDRTSLLY